MEQRCEVKERGRAWLAGGGFVVFLDRANIKKDKPEKLTTASDKPQGRVHHGMKLVLSRRKKIMSSKKNKIKKIKLK